MLRRPVITDSNMWRLKQHSQGGMLADQDICMLFMLPIQTMVMPDMERIVKAVC